MKANLLKMALLWTTVILGARCAVADTCASSLADAGKRYQASPNSSLAQRELREKLTFEGNGACLVAAILQNPAYTESTFERSFALTKAAFQQQGSNNGSGGSTNVVSKGITANILSLASEYGALTESVSSQNITISGTLAGIPTLLERENILEPCTPTISFRSCIPNGTINTLSRFSYSVAFPANQASPQVSAVTPGSSASSQPTTFAANYQSISAVTAKAVIFRGASASPSEITKAITNLKNGDLDATAASAALDRLTTDFPESSLRGWIDGTPDGSGQLIGGQLPALKTAPNDEAVQAIWESWSQSLPEALCKGQPTTCKLKAEAASYADAYAKYLIDQNRFFEGLRKAAVLSVEYDANFPVSQPSNSTARVIAALPFGKSGVTLTANGAVSFYNGTPSTTVPGAQIFRDFQLAAETAYTFGSKTPSFLGQSTISAAYYYQDQTSPAILNVTPTQPVPGVTFTGLPTTATQVFAQRGVINLAQAKFNFIPGKGSINVPFSVTWSNRTELVTHSVWRTQIGISYDFDSLFSGIGK
jgi:hypothetical protein